METEIPTDAEAFFIYLADEVKDGGCGKSPEELLQTWRATQSEAIGDIRQSIQDLEAGRFRQFDEIDAEIRTKFGFPARQG